jgi:hypothetical protein
MQNDTQTNSLPQWDSSSSPFRVPEGYFDSLTARVMQQIPETALPEPRARKLTLKPYFRWAAVSLATIGLGVGAYLMAVRGGMNMPHDRAGMQAVSAQMPVNDNLEQMADYMMLDQDYFYAYLSAE